MQFVNLRHFLFFNLKVRSSGQGSSEEQLLQCFLFDHTIKTKQTVIGLSAEEWFLESRN